jgi:hypothetical protein
MQPKSSDKLLCDLIVRYSGQHRLKVARIAADVFHELKSLRRTSTDDQFDRCIAHLEKCGIIEIFGDAERWRFSELRLLKEPSFVPPPPELHTAADSSTPAGSVWEDAWMRRMIYDD